MLAIVNTLVLHGIEAKPVRVEVDIHSGLPSFTIVGLASQSVNKPRKESGPRLNAGLEFPCSALRLTWLRRILKEGSHFDLPIAVGICRQPAAAGRTARQLLPGRRTVTGRKPA